MVEYNKSENDFLNIIKFIASVLIVGSHTLPLFKNGSLNYYYGQWFFRFCVPLFFISTGYYYYSMEKSIRFKYIRRLVKIYIISVIIYFPLIIIDSRNLLDCFKYFVFGYVHLWYLISLIVALLIIELFRKIRWLSTERATSLIVCLLLFGALFDEYYKIINIGFLNDIGRFMYELCWGSRNFLFFAFPMVLLGMLIKKHNKVFISFSKKNSLFVLLLFFSFLSLLEAYYLRRILGDSVTLDISIFNMIPSIIIFLMTQTYSIKLFDDSKILRKMADIIYIIHMLVLFFIDQVIHFKLLDRFLLCFLISFVLSGVIVLFGKKNNN